ncbi:hypothetical protein H6P81_005243 [Aristolochia fimbriata]|uniref:Uncharacterized protein n=1 Tax=Aristolochia fimbriata TaxID=158543 RepID=A0AAV7EUM4_ARIFI|nr:hypothetical protein H6P81_005243 [Aristolochia fimbriata]
MRNEELVSNVVALGITVITVIVNMGIQMGTGVIFVLWPEHIMIMGIMVVLLAIVVSASVSLPAIKQFLEDQYVQKTFRRNPQQHEETFRMEMLRMKVKRSWLLAHSGNGEFVLARSPLCGSSGVLCLLGAVALAEAGLRLLITGKGGFCDGASDYEWSTMVIFVSQCIAIAVGTITPLFRWVDSAVSGDRSENLRPVERYWIQKLEEWKRGPFPFQTSSRRSRRMGYSTKALILNSCVQIQKSVVITSKLIRLDSTQIMIPLYKFCKRDGRRGELIAESPQFIDANDVLYLHGEDLRHVEFIQKKGREAAEQWIERGRKHEPIHFLGLLREHFSASRSFGGVVAFDNEAVHSLLYVEPPHCWSLALATLVTISVSLPNTDPGTIEGLLKGSYEGLRYVKLVETNMDEPYPYPMMTLLDAADMVWEGIDVQDRWLDFDLQKYRQEARNSEQMIRKLADLSETFVKDFRHEPFNSIQWPAELLAANAMHRATQTILMNISEDLLQWLLATIADIFAACLNRLPYLSSKQCSNQTIAEERETSARKTAHLLGETENILKRIHRPDFSPTLESIKSWREVLQRHE